VTAPEDTASVAEPTLDHGVTLKEIASHFGVHHATVSPGCDGAKSGRAGTKRDVIADPTPSPLEDHVAGTAGTTTPIRSTGTGTLGIVSPGFRDAVTCSIGFAFITPVALTLASIAGCFR